MNYNHKINKPCQICGEIMYGVTDRRRFCKRCAREKSRKNCMQKAAEKQETLAEAHVDRIPDAAKVAREKGLSYGKYMALQYAKQQSSH